MYTSVCNEKPCPAVYIRDSWSKSFTSQDRCSDKEAAYEAVVSYREWANPPRPCYKGSDAARLVCPKGKKCL